MDKGVLPTKSWREKLVSLRRQAEITDAWLELRLDQVVPELMNREELDMWIVMSREYNEDPVILTMVPAAMMQARRRTILVFSRTADGSVERLGVNPPTQADRLFPNVWDADTETQWECLARVVRDKNPQSIGLNFSRNFAFGDGLTYTDHQQLTEALAPDYIERIQSAERLAIGWLERRIPAEIEAYEGIMQIAHGLIAEAFSNQVVHPGVTTSQDVVWWMREKMQELGLRSWFQPSISIQRSPSQPPSPLGADVIIAGDLLHCDVGFTYLGLCTDTQQNAYVLQRGETDAPAGLKAALADGNRLQDIHAENMVAGRSGNQILEATVKQATEEGIKASVYTHAIGFHGHAAGPIIGLIHKGIGRPVPGAGDYELFDDTCYSMELNVKKAVPEWEGKEVTMALEQDVLFSKGQITYMAGRQTQLHLVE